MKILSNIDTCFLGCFYSISKYLNLSTYMEKFSHKDYDILSLRKYIKSEDLLRLLDDSYALLKNNYEFIFKMFRYYIYACLILHAVIFTVCLIFAGFESTLFIVKFLLFVHKKCTFLWGKYRFLLTTFYVWPFKIMRLIFDWLFSFRRKPATKNECWDDGESDKKMDIEEYEWSNPNYPKDPTQYELNCINNKRAKVFSGFGFLNDIRMNGAKLAAKLTHDEIEKDEVFEPYTKFKQKWKDHNFEFCCSFYC